MHFFVTGASGLIGRSVVKELISRGHTVLGLARSDKSAEIVSSLGAKVHRGELKDLESLKSGAAKCDGVAHLAFIHDFDGNFDYAGWCKADRDAINAIGEALKGTDKPFVVTSGTLLLPQGRLVTEQDVYDPEDAFSKIRGASEDATHSWDSQGVRSMVIRLAPTNHGHEDHGFITILINIAKKAGFAGYIGDGANTWSAVHKLDTAALFALALEKGKVGATYHAVAEQAVPLKDIAEAIGKKAGLPTKSLDIEEGKKHFGNFAFAVAGDSKVSSEATRAQLGWTPKHVTLLADIAGDAYA